MPSNRITMRVLLAALAIAIVGSATAGCARVGGASRPSNARTSALDATSAPAPTPVGSSAPTGSTSVDPAILEPPSYTGYESLPIFTYHHVDPKLKNDIAITPAVFEAQLKVLRDGGYHTITARQLVDHQRVGTPLPDKPVMITFDDGWRNQFTYAAPLLKKYGFTATFFINPQPIASGYGAYMTADMVKALARDGYDIESHTWRHLRLIRSASQSAATFQQQNMSQLKLANDWIRRVVGVQPVALCYPFGFYDTEAIAMAQRAGYRAGFTTDEGVADARGWDAYGMKRFTIERSDTLASFKARLTSAPMPGRDIQPPPATRVAGITTTVTVDVTDVPSSVQGLTLASGQSMKGQQIVERNGRRFVVAQIRKARVGLRVVVLRGQDAAGRLYVSSWVIVLGDKP